VTDDERSDGFDFLASDDKLGEASRSRMVHLHWVGVCCWSLLDHLRDRPKVMFLQGAFEKRDNKSIDRPEDVVALCANGFRAGDRSEWRSPRDGQLSFAARWRPRRYPL
jgi:hypothetical protein